MIHESQKSQSLKASQPTPRKCSLLSLRFFTQCNVLIIASYILVFVWITLPQIVVDSKIYSSHKITTLTKPITKYT